MRPQMFQFQKVRLKAALHQIENPRLFVFQFQKVRLKVIEDALGLFYEFVSIPKGAIKSHIIAMVGYSKSCFNSKRCD